jgi:hypothetical protein
MLSLIFHAFSVHVIFWECTRCIIGVPSRSLARVKLRLDTPTTQKGGAI